MGFCKEKFGKLNKFTYRSGKVFCLRIKTGKGRSWAKLFKGGVTVLIRENGGTGWSERDPGRLV